MPNTTDYDVSFKEIQQIPSIFGNCYSLSAAWIIHYLFDTARVYTIVKITLKQNYILLYIS